MSSAWFAIPSHFRREAIEFVIQRIDVRLWELSQLDKIPRAREHAAALRALRAIISTLGGD